MKAVREGAVVTLPRQDNKTIDVFCGIGWGQINVSSLSLASVNRSLSANSAFSSTSAIRTVSLPIPLINGQTSSERLNTRTTFSLTLLKI